MAAPRHLWSGEWEDESARRRAELAGGRREGAAPPPPPDEPPTLPRPALGARRSIPIPRPPALRRPRWRVPRPRIPLRRPSRALMLAAVALLVAGGAYAALSGGGSSPPVAGTSPQVSGTAPWLGVQLESLPLGGIVVVTVAPGSPAEQAGIEPGDVISEVNNHAINGPNDLGAALSGLQAGDTVEIQVSRGSTVYTTHATLASRPTSFP